MEKYFSKKDDSSKESRVEQKRPRIELDMNDIVADPGLRKPIDEFHPDIRDDARKAYIQMVHINQIVSMKEQGVKLKPEVLLNHGFLNLIG